MDESDNRATGIQQLAAIRALLNSDRRATEHDILITTSLELLSHGPRTLAGLVEHARRLWSLAGITSHHVQTAMDTAQAAGIVVIADTLEGPAYAVSGTGRAELAGSSSWARDAIESLAQQIQDRTRDGYGLIAPAEALLWADLLCRSLFIGIAGAQTVFQGAVSLLPDNSLVPTQFDVPSMFNSLDRAAVRSEANDFMRTLVLAAIDPSDPFANELVSDICTAFILHAFLARRDQLAARSAVGSLQGRRALLDTPILLRMLASGRQSDGLQRAVHVAVEAGVVVQVPVHVFEELHGLLDRVERDYVESITRALSSGADPQYLQWTVDDEVVGLWLGCMVSGKCASWAEFRHEAVRLTSSLGALGVVIRDHGNDWDEERVAECRTALTEVLGASRAERGRPQIERDAHTMAIAWRARRNQGPIAGAFWPECWVVTPDKHMGVAYARVAPDDPVSLTIHPAHWLEVLSACGDPAALDDLARSAAELISYETVMSIARKYPPRIAADLAVTLRPESGASTTDMRAMQLSLEDLLSDSLDFVNDPAGSAAKIAGAVVAKRSRRLSEGYARSLSRASDAVEESQEAQRKQEHELAFDHARIQELEQDLVLSNKTIDSISTQMANDRALRNRQLVSVLVVFIGLAVSLAAFLIANYTLLIGTILAILIFCVAAYDWVTDPSKSWHRVLVALLGELIPIVAQGWSWLKP